MANQIKFSGECPNDHPFSHTLPYKCNFCQFTTTDGVDWVAPQGVAADAEHATAGSSEPAAASPAGSTTATPAGTATENSSASDVSGVGASSAPNLQSDAAALAEKVLNEVAAAE